MRAKLLLILTLYFLLNPVTPRNFNFDLSSLDDSSYNELDQSAAKPRMLNVSKLIGQVSGLGIDNDGNLVVFHRAGRIWNMQSFDEQNRFNVSGGPIKKPTLFVVDPKSGKVVKEGGSNMYYMPHGLTVDSSGNVWITDAGLHQVFKLDKNLNELMSLGEKLVPGSDNAHFCKPTDVAVMGNGDFFVADGYCNSRIMKFDKRGVFITSFGRPNGDYEITDGSLLVPHSITILEAMKIICVADRENERIQCFSTGGNDEYEIASPGVFITKTENIGRVYAIRSKEQYIVGLTAPNLDTDDFQLFLLDMESGRAKIAMQDIQNAHALDVKEDGTVYIGQTGPNQILELSLFEDTSIDEF